MSGKIPCRFWDKDAPRVMFSAFGNPKISNKHGDFDIDTDTAFGVDGEVIHDYYREKLGVLFYSPIDKSVHRKALSGWCSWQYYCREITVEEILANAEWLSNLPEEYDLKLIQIDDGWQEDMRNWNGVRDRFSCGMKKLAENIKEMGLIPGIWICPHGQDNKQVAEDAGCFMIKTDGSPLCSTFGGKYTIDPTHKKAESYLKKLMSKVTEDWGYKYIKWDGIKSVAANYGVHEIYNKFAEHFSTATLSGDEGFRILLETVKNSCAPGTFIGGCGILAEESAGLCHSQRTGDDVDNEWNKGFLNAVEATMNGYYLHNICWHSDPDYCMLRSPLSYEMAQAWATLLGITGQMLLFSDRMPDLGEKRVQLLKKITPVADITPVDLFPCVRHKKIFDLKINYKSREYDVVAIFNYDDGKSKNEHLDFAQLGLKNNARYHVYDFWNEEYPGIVENGIFCEIPPASCKCLTIYEEDDFPVLISTNRHILQGWPDLLEFSTNKIENKICGKSHVIKNEKYKLTIAKPCNCAIEYHLTNAVFDGIDNIIINEGRTFVSISFVPVETQDVNWTLSFEKRTRTTPPTIHSHPLAIAVKDISPWQLEASWVALGSPAAYCIEYDGALQGYSFSNKCGLNNLEYGKISTIRICAADMDGRKGEKFCDLDFKVGETLPSKIYLSDINWESSHSGYFPTKRDRSVSGGNLTCGGKRYAKGLGSCADSKIAYTLKGSFRRLRTYIGIEDNNGAKDDQPAIKGRATFRISGNGRDLIEPVTLVHGAPPEYVDIDISDVDKLEMIAEKPKDNMKNSAPHVNWMDIAIEF